MANHLPLAKKVMVLRMLCEGLGQRATARLVGTTSINTVRRLVRDAGVRCQLFHDDAVQGIRAPRVEIDELWSLVKGRSKNLRPENQIDAGAVWTWIAMDPDTKLLICWTIGCRGEETGKPFLEDLRKRVVGPLEIFTDANPVYAPQIEAAFKKDATHRLPPTESFRYFGVRPSFWHKGYTSHSERLNGTLRATNARFSRASNTISKKIEYHRAMMAIWAVHYNFVRIHKTLRVTPAMAAGLSGHVWDTEEIFYLYSHAHGPHYLPGHRPHPVRGPYRKTLERAAA